MSGAIGVGLSDFSGEQQLFWPLLLELFNNPGHRHGLS